MRNCLLKKLDYNPYEVCLKSFKITGNVFTEQNAIDFAFAVDKFQSDAMFKAYDICKWLSIRGIGYSLSFVYDKNRSFLWNIKKYQSFLRLKYRLNADNYETNHNE